MNKKAKKIVKRSIQFLVMVAGIILLLAAYLFLSPALYKIPAPLDPATVQDKIAGTEDLSKNSWIQQNEYGLWEMYLKGAPFERGYLAGKRSQELIQKQEEAFVAEIKRMIPSEGYIKFLRNFIAIFNRKLDKNIPQEYQEEIYGVSLAASDAFDFIGPSYQRMLNYHAAHDIGHALQNMNLVACSVFGTWDAYSEDSSLIIGRNFDFHVGDEFSEEKTIQFMEPADGYRFVMITWGGMMGVVSGMNEAGLSITLNAAKSDIPTKAATPVSIIAREMLQYADDIASADSIARIRESFVAESFYIGSAKDGKAAVIEKKPKQQALFQTSEDYLVSTNHFQTPDLKHKQYEGAARDDYATLYRYQRMEELIDSLAPFNAAKTAALLRDQKGLDGKNIGMGNEKAVNQLIAHHSIIFQPDSLRFWVSTKPYQLGTYLCYNLMDAFQEQPPKPLYRLEKRIPADRFVQSEKYKDFKTYRELKKKIINSESLLDEIQINNFIQLNPKFYDTYRVAGDHYAKFGKSKLALRHYEKALEHEIANLWESASINEKIKQLQD